MQGPGDGQSDTLIIGREQEMPALERFLAEDGVPRALVLVGLPGIGKTTLWEVAVAAARRQGLVCLCARASEAEAQLPFAGLADLLDGVQESALARLPAPQLHALEVALRRAEPAGEHPEPVVIFAGVLSALRLLAIDDRLLVAVDDVQWLDSGSAQAVAFAAKRLTGHRVRLLFSRRPGRRTAIERVFEQGAIGELNVGGLSFGAINHLLTKRLSRTLPRRTLKQIYETSQGNPLFALELGRTVIEGGIPELGELPMPELPEELFGFRVGGLPASVRRVLLATSLSAGLARDVLERIADPLAVQEALASGVVVAERSRVRPYHPLLAAAAAGHCSTAERREMHLALAGAVDDQTLRARHLALTAVGPDPALASEVARAARVASRRGAFADAVELAARALRVTPPNYPEYPDRLLALAEFLITSGDHASATELLSGKLDVLPAGPVSAAANLLLGESSAAHALEEQYLDHAIEQSAGDPGLHSRALARRAILRALGRIERLEEAEQMAIEALHEAGTAGPEAECRALVAVAWVRVLRGRPIDELVRRFPAQPPESSAYDSSIDRPAGVALAFRGEVAKARALFTALLAAVEDRGEARSGAVLLNQLCELELRAGEATAVARLLEDWSHRTGLEEETPSTRARLAALLAGLRGSPEEALGLAAAAIQASEDNPWLRWDWLESMRAKGIAALLCEDAGQATASFRAVDEYANAAGITDPGAFPVAGDLVEALVEAGDLTAAGEVTARLQKLAAAQCHSWGLVTARRCAAVIELAAGHSDAAASTLAAAAIEYGKLGLRFDEGRSWLHLGRIQRRHRKRSSARTSLERAIEVFARTGCSGWAEMARAELGRVSGRRAAEEGELTPSERRVGELAAAGMSNKEIAARLVLSVYTVEAHLSNAYSKLGIRSRIQLAKYLGDPG